MILSPAIKEALYFKMQNLRNEDTRKKASNHVGTLLDKNVATKMPRRKMSIKIFPNLLCYSAALCSNVTP